MAQAYFKNPLHFFVHDGVNMSQFSSVGQMLSYLLTQNAEGNVTYSLLQANEQIVIHIVPDGAETVIQAQVNIAADDVVFTCANPDALAFYEFGRGSYVNVDSREFSMKRKNLRFVSFVGTADDSLTYHVFLLNRLDTIRITHKIVLRYAMN